MKVVADMGLRLTSKLELRCGDEIDLFPRPPSSGQFATTTTTTGMTATTEKRRWVAARENTNQVSIL